ncbi:MAG: hypothetical protein QOD26_1120 [Betaproteobacteria bacterium]|jgi:hypothetical protein|nr:hypothetical protein [Betaproteobacteria bacterium]
MKYLTAVLVALGFAGAALADDLPPNESAYGYSMSDPYTDGTIIVQEYVVTAPDVIVLVPMEQSESTSHVPG